MNLQFQEEKITCPKRRGRVCVGVEQRKTERESSVHGYLFLQHAAQLCPTWMTSCVLFEKIEG